MKLVNVLQRQRYKNDIESMIRLIAPDLLGGKDAVKIAIDRMQSIGVVSRQERTYIETRLQAKVICLIMEKLFREHGYEVMANICLIDKESAKPGLFGKLVHLSGPHLPDEYEQMVDGLEFSQFTGPCGRAVAKNGIEMSVDMENEYLFKDFTEKYNINTIVSCPIHADGEIIGILALFSCEKMAVSDECLAQVQQEISDMEYVFTVIQERWRNRDVFSWKFIIDNEFTVYYLEEEAKHAIGWEYTDTAYRDCREFIHPDDLPEFETGLKEVFEHHKTWRQVFRCKTKNGNYETLETFSIPITEDNGLRYVEVFTSYNTKACKDHQRKVRKVFPYVRSGLASLMLMKMYYHLHMVINSA